MEQDIETKPETKTTHRLSKSENIKGILNTDYIYTSSFSLINDTPAKAAASALLNWKSKYDNVELPHLYKGLLSDCENDNEMVLENILEKNDTSSTSIELPPILKPRSERLNNKSNAVLETMVTVDQLQKQISEHSNLLQIEKNQRLEVQGDMCPKLHNTEESCNKDGELFLKLCVEENSKECRENVKKCYDTICEKKKKLCRQKSVPSNTKNFVVRNIELAALAMSKHSLTDEEKHHLEQILSDLDICNSSENSEDSLQSKHEKTEKTGTRDNVKLTEYNAFVLNEDDKKRILEIDFELKNKYNESENVRVSNATLEDNFWKSLILDQMLKQIDEKLANIRLEDKVKDNTKT